MKKLIKILNGFVLVSAPASTVAVLSNVYENEMLEPVEVTNNDTKIKPNSSYSLTASDNDEEQIMKDLEQASREIEKWLQEKIIIAEGKKIFKDVKRMIEIHLAKIVATKKVSLDIEFVNSIFSDDDIIYKAEDAFDLEIDLTSNVHNTASFSGNYNAPSIIGISKSDLGYGVIKKAIKNLFANEKFQDKLVGLTNLEANGMTDIWHVSDALNKIDNIKLFGQNEKLSEYRFQYNLGAYDGIEIFADQPVSIDLNVYDANTNMPFLSIKFDLKFYGTYKKLSYEKIAEQIKSYLNNKEIDLSKFEQFNADGKMTWKETLWKLSHRRYIATYFNFEKLGIELEKQYENVVSFEMTLNNEKFEQIDNTYIAYNSEQRYVPIKLKISKLKSSDKKYEEVGLKIKVGGLTEQQIYQKQEEARVKFEEVNKNRSSIFVIMENLLFFSAQSGNWKWKDQLNFLKHNPEFYWNFFDFEISDRELNNYLDFDFSIENEENKDDPIEEQIFTDTMQKHLKINVTVTAKGKKTWVNNEKHVYSSEFYVGYNWKLVALKNSIHVAFDKNKELFTTTKLKSGTDKDGHVSTIKDLKSEINEKIRKLIAQDLTFKKLSEMASFTTNIGRLQDEKASFIEDDVPLEKGEYKMFISYSKKNEEKISTISLFDIKIA